MVFLYLALGYLISGYLTAIIVRFTEKKIAYSPSRGSGYVSMLIVFWPLVIILYSIYLIGYSIYKIEYIIESITDKMAGTK